MKSLFYWSVVAVLTGFCSVLCSGQCTDGFTEMHFHCEGPDGCSDDVYPDVPDESEYGVLIEADPLDCCGQTFSSFTAGGFCNPDILKKPGVKEQVARLAATADVLVADCKGRYVPYIPSARRAAPRRQLTLADEHILR